MDCCVIKHSLNFLLRQVVAVFHYKSKRQLIFFLKRHGENPLILCLWCLCALLGVGRKIDFSDVCVLVFFIRFLGDNRKNLVEIFFFFYQRPYRLQLLGSLPTSVFFFPLCGSVLSISTIFLLSKGLPLTFLK